MSDHTQDCQACETEATQASFQGPHTCEKATPAPLPVDVQLKDWLAATEFSLLAHGCFMEPLEKIRAHIAAQDAELAELRAEKARPLAINLYDAMNGRIMAERTKARIEALEWVLAQKFTVEIDPADAEGSVRKAKKILANLMMDEIERLKGEGK